MAGLDSAASTTLRFLDELSARDERSADTDDGADERPIFLLACGWRTGSTLVQRALVTDPAVLLWGEPLGRMALLPRLVEMLACISPSWPPDDYWAAPEVVREDDSELARSWIANTFPPIGDLKAALRQLVLRWLRDPALERGFTRWGLKEVRLGASEAQMLKWLFPKACFVVVVRDPRDAYLSATGGGRSWHYYERYPEGRIDTAAAFARHWNRLAMSWVAAPASLGHIVCRYEDVVSGAVDFREIDRRLGLTLHEGIALDDRVGGSREHGKVSMRARIAIEWNAREGMREYGYSRRRS